MLSTHLTSWTAVVMLLFLAPIEAEKNTSDFSHNAFQNFNFSEGCGKGAAEEIEIICKQSQFSDLTVFNSVSEVLRYLTVNHSKVPFQVLDKVNLKNLEKLHLTSDGIRYVLDSAFDQLTKLTKLELRDNQISIITNKTFEGLQSLEILVLEGNPIHVISSGTFTGAMMPKLNFLKLSKCSIYRLEMKWLTGLERLAEIDLNDNSLTEFPDLYDESDGLKNISVVNLERNFLTHITIDTDSSFRIPKNLKTLMLTNNSISSVEIYVLSGSALAQSALEQLHLGHNVINLFKTKGLELMKNLRHINLEYNQLTGILEIDLPLSKMEQMKSGKVLLAGNPWNCSGCEYSWVIDHPAISEYSEELKCRTPQALYDVSVDDTSVFSSCRSPVNEAGSYQSGVAMAIVIILVFSMIITIAVIIIIRRKHRKRRDGLAWQSPTPVHKGVSGSQSVSYRQMETLSQFSINEDD